MKYKLGEKASFFYDPSTGFMVYPGDEVEITPQQKTKKVQKAISAGHLVAIDTPSKSPEPTIETTPPTFKSMADLKKGVLRTLKLDEIQVVVEKLGFDEEDMEKVKEFTVKKDLIEFVLEAAKGYQDDEGEE